MIIKSFHVSTQGAFIHRSRNLVVKRLISGIGGRTGLRQAHGNNGFPAFKEGKLYF